MRIGEVSRRTGVSARSLRYYEQEGVLSAHRSANGYRDFGDEALARVAMIQSLLSAGLPMAIIRDVLVCTEGFVDPADGCDDVVHRMTGVRDRLEAQAAHISEQVAILDQFPDVARGTRSSVAS